MRHGNAAVCHHDHQIPQAQFEACVPAHAQNDDLSVEVPVFEQIFGRDEPLHLFIIARHPWVCTRAPRGIGRRCPPFSEGISVGCLRHAGYDVAAIENVLHQIEWRGFPPVRSCPFFGDATGNLWLSG
jgi:hypothetical protein